jgi:hypothetical protein
VSEEAEEKEGVERWKLKKRQASSSFRGMLFGTVTAVFDVESNHENLAGLDCSNGSSDISF